MCSSYAGGLPDLQEPSPADLRAIEAEWPVIEAELAVVEASPPGRAPGAGGPSVADRGGLGPAGGSGVMGVLEMCRCCGEQPVSRERDGVLCEHCAELRHECPNHRYRALEQWPAMVPPLTRAEVMAARLGGDRGRAGEWWAECGPCEDFAGPFGSEAAAVQAVGGHDDRYHCGEPTATVDGGLEHAGCPLSLLLPGGEPGSGKSMAFAWLLGCAGGAA